MMLNELERRLSRRETQLLLLLEQHPGTLWRDLALGLAVLVAAYRAGQWMRGKRPA